MRRPQPLLQQMRMVPRLRTAHLRHLKVITRLMQHLWLRRLPHPPLMPVLRPLLRKQSTPDMTTLLRIPHMQHMTLLWLLQRCLWRPRRCQRTPVTAQ